MIQVTISWKFLESLGSDIHAGMHTLHALKAAGIPVVGVLLPMGVAEGVLDMRHVATTGDVLWSWDGEESLA